MVVRSHFSILVVDDDDAHRYALSRTLKSEGFNVLEAATGAQALELSEYVSAVLLDVHLPDLHGLEVCRLLRARPRTATLPIIHVSALYRTEQDARAGIEVGADAYLTAPVSKEVLTAKLDELLGRIQLRGV